MSENASEPLKNSRWERFAREVVALGDQTKAMLVAFPHRRKWKRETVWSKSAWLASQGIVKARVAYLKTQAADAAMVTREHVLDEWAKLAFTDLPDVVCYDGKAILTVIDFEKLTKAQRASIKEIKFRREVLNSTRRIEHVELKFHDKQKALDSLARHLGMYESDNHRQLTGIHGGPIQVKESQKVELSKLSGEEKKQLGSALRKILRD